jgi:hypothetical protein
MCAGGIGVGISCIRYDLSGGAVYKRVSSPLLGPARARCGTWLAAHDLRSQLRIRNSPLSTQHPVNSCPFPGPTSPPQAALQPAKKVEWIQDLLGGVKLHVHSIRNGILQVPMPPLVVA